MKEILFALVLLLPLISRASPILVTIPPQKEWVREVGPEGIRVEVLVPRGHDPHTYEPSPRTLKAVVQAETYLVVGSGIEFEAQWLGKIRELNPRLEVVETFEGVDLIEGDPHVWLSLRNAEKAILKISKVMIEKFPQEKGRIGKRTEAYLLRLRELDRRIAQWMKPHRGRAFLSFHPAWTYFARDYGLRQLVVEREGKEPGPRSLMGLIKEAKQEGIRVIFVSPRFDRRLLEAIAAELRAEIRILDPLREDYLANMEEVAKEILRSFEWR